MANSGYVLVDFTGVNLLAETEVTVKGLYDQCAAAVKTGKPVIACNCEYGSGVPMTPIAIMGIIDDGTFVFTASTYQISVDSDDGVTIVSLLS